MISMEGRSPSLFFSSSKCFVLKDDIKTSKGVTVSTPYDIQKRVSHVTSLWVILYDQRIVGISSTLIFFLFPSSFFFRELRIDLLAASTCPLVCRCPSQAEIFECFTIKLGHIVGDDDPRHPKPPKDGFPYKSFDVGCLDISKWFCSYPLSEIINCNYQELILSNLSKWEPSK